MEEPKKIKWKQFKNVNLSKDREKLLIFFEDEAVSVSLKLVHYLLKKKKGGKDGAKT